jgi:hypothetical protein
MTITYHKNHPLATGCTIIPLDVLHPTIQTYVRQKSKAINYIPTNVLVAYAGEWFFIYLRDGTKLEQIQYDKIIVLLELK